MRIPYRQEIDAPIETVFKYLDDDEHMKHWMKGLDETTYPHGRDRDNPVGTRFRQKLKEGGRIQEYDGEVTAYEKPHHLGVRLFGPAFSVQVDYRLTALGDRSVLDYLCELEFANRFYRIMGTLFGWLTKGILRKQMAALKALAEADARGAIE